MWCRHNIGAPGLLHLEMRLRLWTIVQAQHGLDGRGHVGRHTDRSFTPPIAGAGFAGHFIGAKRDAESLREHFGRAPKSYDPLLWVDSYHRQAIARSELHDSRDIIFGCLRLCSVLAALRSAARD